MKAFLILLFLPLPLLTQAAEPSPVGLWQTVDDNDGQPAAIVRIQERNGLLEGAVVRILPRKGADPEALCENCDGARKNQPIQGMTILWGLKRDGQEFAGGEILDPDNGSIYRCRMRLTGDRLEVRGYLGISLFGRSQTWTRMP